MNAPAPNSKLAAFLARPAGDNTPTAGVTSNTAEGMALARDLRALVQHASTWAPRSQQIHLGPSEIGPACHRQVAGKLAGLPRTNHVADPWPSYVGTAVHAKLEEDVRKYRQQWFPERRVVPMEGHSGTADLFLPPGSTDYLPQQGGVVVDHKVQGTTTHTDMVRHGPHRTYFVQAMLYSLGYINAGYPVAAVAIASWARHGGLYDLYVWWHDITPEDWALVMYVINVELPYRKQWAEYLRAFPDRLMDVPIGDFAEKPSCIWCPFFRPEKKHNPGVAGCPGPS